MNIEEYEDTTCPKCGDSDYTDCQCAIEKQRQLEEKEN